MTEQWGSTTGIRRLVSGVDIFTPSATYSPRLTSTGADLISGQYFTTDYVDLSVQFYCNSTRYDSLSWANVPSGVQNFTWYLTPSAPSGTYEVRIIARSVFNSSNTAVAKAWVSVDTSITNQIPVVNGIYFPDGDSCFVSYAPRLIAADAYDPNGSVSRYSWSCYPSDAGDFSDTTANLIYFTAYPNKKAIGTRSVRVKVADNYGQWSALRSLDIDRYLVSSLADCPCYRCGDANSSGAVNISDAVFLIAYIFAGGTPPGDCIYANGKGDANGTGTVNISDAVYLIAYIFAGGTTPHCQ